MNDEWMAWLDPVRILAVEASAQILRIYATAFGVTTKDDDSPLTAADLAAHHVIVAGLQRLTPEIPVLSEESANVPFAERSQWRRYWLVDPLDGTKEFVQRNGQFTVNIALIENQMCIRDRCFTVPPDRAARLETVAATWDCRCTRIGVIEAKPGLRLVRADGSAFSLEQRGYDHFG